MRYWVYKCNAKAPDYAGATGDWVRDVFDDAGVVEWGDTSLKGVEDVASGDVLIAYQTDRNELVGTVLVEAVRPSGGQKKLFVSVLEPIGAKVRPLKKADARVGAIPALQGGDIRTAYPISVADAKRLLVCARSASRSLTKRKRLPTHEKNDLLASFKELPGSDRQEYLRLLKIVARSARLRRRVLQIWDTCCAACGRRLRDGDGNPECEIAHIHEVHDEGPDLIANSIPLCRTHHWAFDRQLWAIHPHKLAIVIKPCAASELAELKGRTIKRPKAISDIQPLATGHLVHRWKKFKQT